MSENFTRSARTGLARVLGRCAPAIMLAAVAGGSAGAAATNAVEVVDDTGARIAMAAPAQRIVSLAPHLTELVYAAGAGDRLVGVVEHSDFPPAARDRPRVGDYAQFDVETILRQKPDLVVAWQSGNPASAVEQLRHLGLVVFVSEPRRLVDIATTIERFGRLAGRDVQAGRAARHFRERLAALRAGYTGEPGVTVFFQFWHQPLMTINGQHLISDAIRLCGGRNIFADLKTLAPTVDEEAVLVADPEAIVVSGGDGRDVAHLAVWRRRGELTAVRRGNLFDLPPELILRHTPRILDGAERLCADLAEARRRRD